MDKAIRAFSAMDLGLVVIFITVVSLLIAWLLREAICWYLKQNRIVELLDSIDNSMKVLSNALVKKKIVVTSQFRADAAHHSARAAQTETKPAADMPEANGYPEVEPTAPPSPSAEPAVGAPLEADQEQGVGEPFRYRLFGTSFGDTGPASRRPAKPEPSRVAPPPKTASQAAETEPNGLEDLGPEHDVDAPFEYCSVCGQPIGMTEQAFLIDGKVICEVCHKKRQEPSTDVLRSDRRAT